MLLDDGTGGIQNFSRIEAQAEFKRRAPGERFCISGERTGTALPMERGRFHFAPRIGTHNFPQLF